MQVVTINKRGSKENITKICNQKVFNLWDQFNAGEINTKKLLVYMYI
jgi:hypothetical protein